MGDARGRRLALFLLLVAGPVLALVAVDRAIVGWSAHWAWVAREVPGGVLDPYRVEAMLRSTEPGPKNVFVLGDSTARDAIDSRALADAFASRRLHFHNLGSNNAAVSTWGMVADPLLDLDPTALIVIVGTLSFQDDLVGDRTRLYALRAAPDIYTLEDVLAQPRAHLNGAIGDLHVFARHRRALQNALLVRLGRRTWSDVRSDAAEPQELHNVRIGAQMDLVKEGRGYQHLVRQPDTYPNSQTRGFERLARRAARRGTTLVVLQTPLNPIVQTPTQARMRREAQTRAYLEVAAESHGFALVTSDHYPRLTGRDFKDGVHMSVRGRRRFTEFLSVRLLALL